MFFFKYLIVGGGMTADSAVQGIRQVDSIGTIGMISAEKDKPYDRPPLSKGLWKNKPLEGIWRKTDSMDVKMFHGYSVRTIDTVKKQVDDDAGNTFSYEKLLLATGGTPRRLPFGGEEIIYFRTVEDYRRLRALCGEGRRFAVIGGGFIGSEIAAALRMNGKEVVMIFPENGIGDRIFPRGLSEHVNSYYRGKGVELVIGDTVEGLERKNGGIRLTTRKQQELLVDGVIAGLGIEPNIGLAMQSGIKTEKGVLVDEMLRTSVPGIYAAGDVAEFFNPALSRKIRVEHEDNANKMGLAAGRGMAGIVEPYYHLPYFYSDMFELGYEAVGILDSRLETYVDWNIPNEKGVVYYLEKERLVGVLLWNVWNKVDDARNLISLVRFNPKGGIR